MRLVDHFLGILNPVDKESACIANPLRQLLGDIFAWVLRPLHHDLQEHQRGKLKVVMTAAYVVINQGLLPQPVEKVVQQWYHRSIQLTKLLHAEEHKLLLLL